MLFAVVVGGEGVAVMEGVDDGKVSEDGMEVLVAGVEVFAGVVVREATQI